MTVIDERRPTEESSILLKMDKPEPDMNEQELIGFLNQFDSPQPREEAAPPSPIIL